MRESQVSDEGENMKRRLGKIAGAFLVLVLARGGATQAQTFTTLPSFDGTDGANPFAGLVQATDGNFYGTTSGDPANKPCIISGIDCGTVFKITPSGTLTTLYSFCSQNGCADGGAPNSALVQATDGNFYGATYIGRASCRERG